MPLADYSHHNEEAAMIWWEEEGKHTDTEPELDDEDWYDEPDNDEDDYITESRKESEHDNECESAKNA